jgi:RsiW-degrading membrane proteinase PrsW (M82 family)
MIILIGILLAAFAPGIFWLWIVYKRDKCEPEPLSLIIRTFLFGVAISIPIALMEALIYPESLATQHPSLLSSAYLSFIVAGVTEEIGKFVLVFLAVYRSRHFNEGMDGLVYSSAAALGFASLENLGYILQFGVQIMLLRGPLSTLAHLVFSAFWGYTLALRKVNKGSWAGVTIGLFISIVVHGLFNFLLFLGGTGFLWVLALLAAGIVAFIIMIVHARRISPYCQVQ